MDVKTFVADFEATTKREDCHVWAWAVVDVDDPENLYIGTDIYDFMFWCEERPFNPRVYMHSLKYDGEFIISWLLKNGYTCVTESKDRASQTFKTMIGDDGQFYAIEVIFARWGKNIKKVTFYDSYKLLPMKVKDIAGSFHLPYKKGKIDYTAHDDLPYNSPITEDEKEYIINDVRIVATALAYLKSQGLDKITIGKCALDEYKKSIGGEKAFKRLFPVLTRNQDEEIRQAYFGGWSYLNPEFSERDVGSGIVLDKNSMFAWVQQTKLLPHGTPKYFKGKYKHDSLYPLYVQMIRCEFELKPGKLPMTLFKRSRFGATPSTVSSEDEDVVLVLNNIDLKLFFENYEVYNEEYLDGWKFMGDVGLFEKYIDEWSGNKIAAKHENNYGLYIVSKLFLTSLYGKFGAGLKRRSKVPYLDKKMEIVRYKDTEPEMVDGVYVPMASFITSYAREEVVRTAQRIMDEYAAGISDVRYVYSDTDSLHILTDNGEIPRWLEVDQYKLGAWKVESVFRRGKFLRSKCYMEQEIIGEKEYEEGVAGDHPYLYTADDAGYYRRKITVAGMPEDCYSQVTFDNFRIGQSYTGKLSPMIVPGGVILTNIDFTIKR